MMASASAQTRSPQCVAMEAACLCCAPLALGSWFDSAGFVSGASLLLPATVTMATSRGLGSIVRDARQSPSLDGVVDALLPRLGGPVLVAFVFELRAGGGDERVLYVPAAFRAGLTPAAVVEPQHTEGFAP